MGTLNRVVNIVILVFALVAVIFGSMLYQKRVQLRDRGDRLAKMVWDVAGILDNNSESAVQKNMDTKKLELNKEKDPANAETNQKKSLYHDNYERLDTVLAPFKKQANDVSVQRDALGVTLKDIAEKLEIPETFAPSHFQSLNTYDEMKAKLVNLVVKVNDRDNALVEQIAKSGGVIGFTVQREALKHLDDFAGPLGEFGAKVEALKRRSDTYATAIASLCRILEVTAPSLSGDDYASAIQNIETAVRGVKEEFERTKTELARVKTELEETKSKLQQTEEKYAKLDVEFKRLKKRYDDLVNPGQPGGGPPTGEEGEQFVRKLKGTVIDVNRKWDFVVIDLGSENKLQVPTRAGVIQEIPVPLPVNAVMVASRNDSYLAKIQVIRVNPTCAIADILPEERKSELQIGDQVFFGEGPILRAAPAAAAPAPAAN